MVPNLLIMLTKLFHVPRQNLEILPPFYIERPLSSILLPPYRSVCCILSRDNHTSRVFSRFPRSFNHHRLNLVEAALRQRDREYKRPTRLIDKCLWCGRRHWEVGVTDREALDKIHELVAAAEFPGECGQYIQYSRAKTSRQCEFSKSNGLRFLQKQRISQPRERL